MLFECDPHYFAIGMVFRQVYISYILIYVFRVPSIDKSVGTKHLYGVLYVWERMYDLGLAI